MNEEKILQKLVSAARGDGPPPVDVADSVLEDLADSGGTRNVLLWFFTAASSAAAAIITVLATRASVPHTEVARALFGSISAAIP